MTGGRWILRFAVSVALFAGFGCENLELPTEVSDPPAFAKGGVPGGGGGGGGGGGKGGGRGGGGGTPATHDPILFVHGYNSSGSTWSTMIGRFKQDGWTDAELFAWSYDYRLSNATIAAQLEQRVGEVLAATGATRVDIITHSMGALSSRYYLKNAASTPVDAWVSLAGPNHGTELGSLCFDASCFEMRVGSPFLTTLNSGDETPGLARYATWRSPCDFIVPSWSVPIDGAVNSETACVAHTDMQNDATIYGQVRTFVSAGS